MQSRKETKCCVQGSNWKSKAVKYAVYRFAGHEKVNIDDPSKIVAVTKDEFYEIPDGAIPPGVKVNYVVTALDRLSTESKPQKKSFKY